MGNFKKVWICLHIQRELRIIGRVILDGILIFLGLFKSAERDVCVQAACSIWSQEVVVIKVVSPDRLWHQRENTLKFSAQ